MSDFGFLTNHGRTLLCFARHPEARMRDVADWLGITERAVQRITVELEKAGYIRVQRGGRRNRYEVVRELPVRHPSEGARTVGHLLGLVVRTPPPPVRDELRPVLAGALSFID